jgi:CBS domain-containing protein
MSNTFAPIPSTKLVTQARLPSAGQMVPSRLSPYHPAADAMVDFHRVPPATICEQADIAIANQRLFERGAQLLLVVGEGKVVTGVVTAGDIDSVRRQQARVGGEADKAVPVREVMTPFSALEVVQMRNVLCSQVGNILSALQRARRQCVLVVEVADDGRGFAVRGAFTAAQIESRLTNVPASVVTAY